MSLYYASLSKWEKFLRSLPGEPTLVICDGDASILAAVARVWPNAFVKRCEHHLRERAKLAMARDGLTGYGSSEMALLDEAFHSHQDWTKFKRSVRGTAIDEWVRQHDRVLTIQVRRRASPTASLNWCHRPRAFAHPRLHGPACFLLSQR
jgi:hypothetical protein